ncbi:Major Facilitator Superfamily protein [Moraxella cuniculi DSM 21768]|uniref:Major Facilitator Superfamily protein n=1 Tax=Moraxella cuniculi DSM 21768 TaxID=1122245 RepID=A0A1N7F244_9GAMM|nr:MFS transporter [Moraxella cuniculi]OOS05048.1 MFS transporter [Moraxella cuniculi]SIR94411.1 Major Facilitator Superfamily protein [Moraxella cuniculi DSM 21768]
MLTTPQAYRKKLPTALKSIVFYGVAFGSFRMLIGGVSVLYLLSRGVSLADLGLLKSFQFALMMFLDLPLSYLTDRYSRKLSTILGIVFGAAWLLMTAAASSLWQFYLAEAFNAVSLSLFNGAYISYLIDIKNKTAPELSTKTLLAYDNKYNSLGMAICAFVGAAFISPQTSAIWYIAGVLLLIIAAGAWLHMPSDQQTPQATSTTNHQDNKLLMVARHAKQLTDILKHKPQIAYALVVISILLVYFQILVQLWQPLVDIVNPSTFGWVYGLFFSVLSIAQILSSSFVDNDKLSAMHKKIAIVALLTIALLLMAMSVSFATKSWYATVGILLSLSLMFFAIKVLMIEASATFHDIIPDAHRSVLDALGFFASRLVLLLLFPLITYLTDRLGFAVLVGIFVMILAVYFVIKYKINKANLA